MEKDKEKIDRKVFVTKGKRVELEEEEEEEKETFVDYFYDEPGTSPGTLIIEEDAPHPRLILINYNKEKENTTELKS
ncbi:MAG TPA: hypothetical protein PL110_20720, partial [Candidatus Eremiobacteraeota bacterium]|nr:hypothetical protein [Candidatus Eremiobacteraeota bacterium]